VNLNKLKQKVCTKCGKKKPLKAFYRFKMKNKRYFRGACKKCWHNQIIVLKKEYVKSPRGFIYSMRAHAKKRSINFLITKIEFTKWWNNQEMKCFYCKRTLQEIKKTRDRLDKKANRLTVDRIHNKKDYALDNIVLCCLRCNFIKGNFFNKNEMLKIGRIVNSKFRNKNNKIF